MRRFLGELGGDQTVPLPPRNRLDGSCYRCRRPAGYALRCCSVATHTPTPPRDLTGGTVDRRLSCCRNHALGLPPVRDPTPRCTPRTRPDPRRVGLQPPRSRRPLPDARPPPVRRRLVSTSRSDSQPQCRHPVRDHHLVALSLPADPRRRTADLPPGNPP